MNILNTTELIHLKMVKRKTKERSAASESQAESSGKIRTPLAGGEITENK